jgi:hypothetical protein
VEVVVAYTPQQELLEQVVLAAEEMQTDHHQREAMELPILEAAAVVHQEMGL